MPDNQTFEIIIIGGSYAGLSAAMALGRSLRNVLVIDSGNPCNRQTPFSHNFITQDGRTPAEITAEAKAQALKYPTVRFYQGTVINGRKTGGGFAIETDSAQEFTAKKLLFATGLTDILPEIPGFAECWGISVLHCPYCHGYEVKNQDIGIIANGDMGFELCRLIHNWTPKLTLFTNGKSTLTEAQTEKIGMHNIGIIEKNIRQLDHAEGQIQGIVFTDQSKTDVSAIFARGGIEQQCRTAQKMGCELTEQGLLKVDDFQKTSVPGIFAAGDNTTLFRAVSAAVASGTKAGAFINKELIDESF